MNEHQRLREMLAYRAELSLAEERQLKAHLTTCPECSALALDYAHQTQMLQSLPTATPPAVLRAEVLNRINQPPPRSGWFGRRGAWLAAPLAFTAALVLAFGLMHRTHDTPHTALQHTPRVPRFAPRATPSGSTPQVNSPVPTALSHTRGVGHPRPSHSTNHSPQSIPTTTVSGPPSGNPPTVSGPIVLGQALPTATAPGHSQVVPTQAPVRLYVAPSPTHHRRRRGGNPVSRPVSSAPTAASPTGVPQRPSPSAAASATAAPVRATPLPAQPPAIHPTFASGIRPTPGPPSPATNSTPTAPAIGTPTIGAQPTPSMPAPSPMLPTPVVPPIPTLTP